MNSSVESDRSTERRVRRRASIVALCLTAATMIWGCSKEPEVRAMRVVRGDIETTVSSVNAGTVRARQVADLAFGAVGRVKRLAVDVGDLVHSGQVLAELENEDLITIKATGEREVKRLESLLRSRVATPTELDRAQNQADAAAAAYDKSLIRAPFDGLIADVNIEVGQLSQITAVVPKPLIAIVDRQPRYLTAEMDEVDLPRLEIGQQARVTILAARRDPFEARVQKVTPIVSAAREQDRTVEIELSVNVPDGMLLPVGASADLEVVVKRSEGVVMVPARAVLGRRGERFVYRLNGSRISKVPVEIGVGNYERTEITSGLDPGDSVVIPCENCELRDGGAVAATVVAWP